MGLQQRHLGQLFTGEQDALCLSVSISGAAWREASETMGDFRAALCVLVTDANRDHPATPIRKPGGNLRALTRRHQAGELNLVGSLIGLAERRDAE